MAVREPYLTYDRFRQEAMTRWTIAQLRCEEPPTEELLDLMDRCGSLEQYERFLTRLQKATDANLGRMAFGSDWR